MRPLSWPGAFLRIIVIFFSSTCFGQVNIQQSVSIGGIQQWISIKGANEKNSVLLFLHGGPGNSAMSYAHKFTNELEKHFVVVLWDQRETGKTLQLNASPQRLTLSLIESDVTEMIDYLLTRFSKNKLYLMGHSWGGFLALRMAAAIPQKLETCLSISPM
ncbi:MAG: alpha/beta fold hydrolase, partial [Flammeovirgaceae bacterium]